MLLGEEPSGRAQKLNKPESRVPKTGYTVCYEGRPRRHGLLVVNTWK